jgi:hypothetical protein
MTPKANQAAITADGEYSLYDLIPGTEVLVEWEITAGSATVTLGIVSMSGVFLPLKDISGTSPVFDPAGGFCRLVIPASGMAAIKVEDAAGLTMKYSQTKIQ